MNPHYTRPPRFTVNQRNLQSTVHRGIQFQDHRTGLHPQPEKELDINGVNAGAFLSVKLNKFLAAKKRQLLTLELPGVEDHRALCLLGERWQPLCLEPLVLINHTHLVDVVVDTVPLVGVSDGYVETQFVREWIANSHVCIGTEVSIDGEVELGELGAAHVELQLCWTVHKP